MSDMTNKMNLFMNGKAEKVEPKKIIVTKRYKDEKGEPVPFEMKPIPQTRIEQLRKDCRTLNTKDEEVFDSERFYALMAVESTVFPDFNDKALKDSYGAKDPVDLAKIILAVPGEYANWIQATNEVNGFNEDFKVLVDDAKN